MSNKGLTRATAMGLGVIPAMPTIFKDNGLGYADAPIDHRNQLRLINYLIKEGVDAILVNGTTGEAATQSSREHIAFVHWCVKKINGRVPVIAGGGSNCTSEAIELTQKVIEAGAQAALIVKPYYNKPNPAGLIAHYSAILDLGLPVITYSVSSRTGGGAIPIDVIAELARKYKNLIGHKEAEGDLGRFRDLRTQCPKDFLIFSGDDGSTLSARLENNCDGTISVTANVATQTLKKVINSPEKMGEKDIEINDQLAKILFIEPNPQPVKTALQILGIIPKACFRLPLVPTSSGNYQKLKEALIGLGFFN